MTNIARWVDEHDAKASRIEAGGTRLSIYEMEPELWCLTVYPFFKDKKLPGRTLEEAKYSAVIATRQWLMAFMLRLEVLLTAAEKGI